MGVKPLEVDRQIVVDPFDVVPKNNNVSAISVTVFLSGDGRWFYVGNFSWPPARKRE
ncbi:hypothetical protein [Mycobacterium parmense]|uniref:hypothetical protein n=1 Tax=Mycobacterium parmense TaxID=185642 RepID=UPI00137479AC|nr:hypothetical protein [Mycobacterium parmense]MCV7351130.1 hypothetical protein [Mycobacterium parmense]